MDVLRLVDKAFGFRKYAFHKEIKVRTSTNMILAILVIFAAGANSHAQNQNASAVQDISLHGQNQFVGILHSSDRQPLASQPVRLLSKSGNHREVTTDQQGRFAFSDVTLGAYVLEVQGQSFPVRAWPASMAPPLAKTHFSKQLSGVSPAIHIQPNQAGSNKPVVEPVAHHSGAQPAGGGSQSCNTNECEPGYKLKKRDVVAGVVLGGLGVWGIIELADDDAPAS